MRRFIFLLVTASAACVVACSGSSATSASSSGTPGTTGATATASTTGVAAGARASTPPAVPSGPSQTKGVPSDTCVSGWRTPSRSSHLFTDPLGIIRRTTGVRGTLVVVDVRYFTGPESPAWLSIGDRAKGYLAVVRRWYVKLYAKLHPSFRGRFLVESRLFGDGLSAAAPYDTNGWRSPDWRGFQYDAGDTQIRTIDGLPGRWSGEEYDFVKGGAGLDFPGLPNQVIGCLAGT